MSVSDYIRLEPAPSISFLELKEHPLLSFSFGVATSLFEIFQENIRPVVKLEENIHINDFKTYKN